MTTSPYELRDYLIVEFPDEGNENSIPLSVVPKVWVSSRENICYWPSLRNDEERRRAVIKKMQFKKESCTSCPIVVKYNTNSYEKAMQKLKHLERSESTSVTTSQSEDDGRSKRKSRPNSLYKDFHTRPREFSQLNVLARKNKTSSSEDDLPNLSPPTIKKKSSRVIDSETDDELDITVESKSNNSQKLPASCCNCKNTEAKLDSAIRKIDLLAHDVKFLLQMVQRNALSEDVETPENVNLPMNQEYELKEFDRKLEDDVFFRNMSASLLSIGGKDIGDSTRRIMAKLVSHELSLQYNWTGRGKKEFKSLRNVLRMILVCLRKNPLCRNATETEIASVIKIWLRNASDRQGGRNRRRTKPAEEGIDMH